MGGKRLVLSELYHKARYESSLIDGIITGDVL